MREANTLSNRVLSDYSAMFYGGGSARAHKRNGENIYMRIFVYKNIRGNASRLFFVGLSRCAGGLSPEGYLPASEKIKHCVGCRARQKAIELASLLFTFPTKSLLP